MTDKLKIVILCGGKTAFESINLLSLEGTLAGIIIGGSDTEAARILEQFARGASLPFLSVSSARKLDQFDEWIQKIQPDYVFSINFPYLIPDKVLNILPDKWFNFHMGPLPSYRGAMPIFEVLKAGEKETAIAVHKMVSNTDEGPVVFQEPVPIKEGETFGSLAIKLRDRTCMVVQNFVQMLQFSTQLPLLPQNEDEAEYFPMPELEETRIVWENMEAGEIVRLVNSCNPWNNGADVLYRVPFKILSATEEKLAHGHTPGTVLSIDNRSSKIACINNTALDIHIIKLESGIFPGSELKQLAIDKGFKLN